jgi:peptidoglycan/xylan/chitin deacetylase (PgdA/CDA1 family)
MMKLLYPLAPYKENKPNNKDYWLQMNKKQISNLSTLPFASIVSHGYYHDDLSRINLSDAGAERAHSKQYLENIIDKSVNSFAFPYGTYTHEVVAAAQNIGYDQLLAINFHFTEDYSDPMRMKERLTINLLILPANQKHAIITRRYEG